MAAVPDVCKKIVESVDDCLAVGVVDLSTGMMMGVHHTIPHFTQAYLDAVAAAAVEMFRGKNVRRIEELLSQQRGEKIQDSFEEVFISSLKTFHFMILVRQKGAVIVMVTKKTTSQGMGWSALRNNIQHVQAALGVAELTDGSAKSALRLLAVRGWVFKTNTDRTAPTADELAAQTLALADTGRRMRLWHPHKTWAVWLSGASWYAASATPELQTLRRITDMDERIQAWTAMIEHAVAIAVDHDVCLDLNPSNFGRCVGDDRIYYIDDEWYPEVRFALFASGIVGRIPEEPGAAEDMWYAWGQVLAGVLSPICRSRERCEELVSCVADHPVAGQFSRRRGALRDGLRAVLLARGAGRKPASGSGRAHQHTAVIADVHGNAPALEAVLAECARLSVDSYLFLGDAVGYGPKPRECVQRLAELRRAQCIRGNHDHAMGSGVFDTGMNRLARSCAGWTHEQLSREEREWLVTLPLDAGGDGWLAVHGAPKDPRRFFAYVYELTFEENLEHIARNNVQLCFCGHTHVQFVHERTLAGGYRKTGTPEHSKLERGRTLLINPGSVGQPRDGDVRAAFAVWHREQESVSLHRVPYAVELVVESLRELNLPHELGERLLRGA